MEIVQIQGLKRDNLGKRGSKDIRKEELIPAVLYGKDSVEHLTISAREVKPIVYTPEFKIAEINIGGKVVRGILKDVQYHPVSDAILHIDFLQLIEGHPVKVEVPVRFKGVSPGVKNGGKMVQKLRKIKIKTTPDKLVNELLLDISGMQLEAISRVRDIQIPAGIEVVNNGSVPVAIIETPRALRSAAAADAKSGKK